MASPPQKVSLDSSNDLKNATDDALAPYLTSLPKPYTFKQDHFTTNIRLALGYTAVLIAGALFYADWKLGWDATKAYTGPACVSYFVLNGILTYWIWAVEAGTVFSGVREGGQRLTLRSSTQKYVPEYKLKVTYSAPSTGKNWEDKEITGKFTQWFNTHGYLQHKEFQQWLNSNIDVLKTAQAERSNKEKSSERVPVLMPATKAEEISTSATGLETASPVPASAKKSRPKKKA
ncbi:putative signal peptidase complex component [Cladophialophora carrionii]|uniref:Signal peptidase complex subunit 2 n=1 Tax=Cladophialophora carrionii TaxID=86049 RepID=A0A1C1CJH8_9EURO|nr:putative signal peptidase complex component [Cladophialophora carrionii]